MIRRSVVSYRSCVRRLSRRVARICISSAVLTLLTRVTVLISIAVLVAIAVLISATRLTLPSSLRVSALRCCPLPVFSIALARLVAIRVVPVRIISVLVIVRVVAVGVVIAIVGSWLSISLPALLTWLPLALLRSPILVRTPFASISLRGASITASDQATHLVGIFHSNEIAV